MSDITLTAGSFRLKKYNTSDTFVLSAQYNNVVTKELEIRGVDNLHALQYLVKRALQKIQSP